MNLNELINESRPKPAENSVEETVGSKDLLTLYKFVKIVKALLHNVELFKKPRNHSLRLLFEYKVVAKIPTIRVNNTDQNYR